MGKKKKKKKKFFFFEKMSGSGVKDPRNAEAVVPFVLKKKSSEEASMDYWGMISILFGVISLIWRVNFIFFLFLLFKTFIIIHFYLIYCFNC